MTRLSVIPPPGEQALGHCSDRGLLMGMELRNPSQWRGSGTCCGLDTPSTLALLRTRLHPLTPGTPRSPKGMAPLHVVPLPLCDSRAALLAITSTPELGAGVRLLPDCPAPALGSLHKCCSGVVRDNNRRESHRNKANTEACCFLFTRILDFNFLVQKLGRGGRHLSRSPP